MDQERDGEKQPRRDMPGTHLINALTALGYEAEDVEWPTSEDIQRHLDNPESRRKLTEPQVRALQAAFEGVADRILERDASPTVQADIRNIEAGIVERAMAAGAAQLPRAEHERRRGIPQREKDEYGHSQEFSDE